MNAGHWTSLARCHDNSTVPVWAVGPSANRGLALKVIERG